MLLPMLAARAAVGVVPVPRPDHVVIVVEENHAAQNILGNPDAPFINALAGENANFTQSFAVTHPSQPNYLALFSGSTNGVVDDGCPRTFTSPNLGDQLLAAGLGFTGYSESLPSVGYTGCTSGPYARKHTPWANWPSIPAAANQPLTAFPADYSTLPAVSFIIPNLVDDMHDGTIAAGDAWLQARVGAYAQWAKQHNSLLIVTFDEDDLGHANQVATIFAGARVKPGSYVEPVNHYSLLRTVQDAFGLAPIANSASAQPILDVWNSAGPGAAPVASFTSSCTALDCAFDATASTDPDGQVVSRGWSFGDGSTGSGVTATHTYAAAGTYQVSLSVTDDAGGTNTLTRPVVATAPPGTPFALDTFDRTVTNGLGSADVGGPWTTSGAATNFSVSPGAARLRTPVAGNQVRAQLGTRTTTDTDLVARISVDRAVTGNGLYVNLIARSVNSANDYRLQARITNKVSVSGSRTAGGVATTIAPERTGLAAYTPNQVLTARAQASGTGPTTVRFKVWDSAGPEPAAWAFTVTDSAPAVQAPGGIGVSSYLSSSATNAPVTLTLGTLVARSTAPAPANQPPTAVFSSSCAGSSCSFDAAGSGDAEGPLSSYAWTFGDAATGAGVTAIHLYAAAGTYPVTLTVTDGAGASASVTQSVTVTVPAGQPFVSDSFNRTVNNGLGTADLGGAWITTGAPANFSVVAGQGRLSLPKAGSLLGAGLPGSTATDTDLTVVLSLDRLASSNGVYFTASVRRISGTSEYRARLRITGSGALLMSLGRIVAGTATDLRTEIVVPGLTYPAGQSLTLRVQAVGSGTTTALRSRVWVTGSAEPATWPYAASDSTASLQAPGSVAVGAYLSSSSVVAPVTVRVSSVTAKPTVP